MHWGPASGQSLLVQQEGQVQSHTQEHQNPFRKTTAKELGVGGSVALVGNYETINLLKTTAISELG